MSDDLTTDIMPFGIAAFRPFAGQAIDLDPVVSDADIFADIVRRLKRLDQFSEVAYPDPVEVGGRRASDRSLVIVKPGAADETEGADDAAWSRIVRKVTYTLEVQVRDDNPERRDRRTGQLMNLARSVLDQRCLAGATLVAFTRLAKERYLDAIPPLRRVAAAGEFAYLIDGPDHRDLNP